MTGRSWKRRQADASGCGLHGAGDDGRTRSEHRCGDGRRAERPRQPIATRIEAHAWRTAEHIVRRPGATDAGRPTAPSRRRMLPVVAVVGLMSMLLSPGGPASAAATLAVAWPSAWHSPLADSTVRINTLYGVFSTGCNPPQTNLYDYYLPDGGTSEHLGLDLYGLQGSPVHAVSDGNVVNAGVGNLWQAFWKGVVLVEHTASTGEKFTAVYGHIDIGTNPRTNMPWVSPDTIYSGELVGRVAELTDPDTGTRIDHLHFGIAPGRQPSVDGSSNNGRCTHDAKGTVDPLEYLRGRTPAGNAPPAAHDPVGHLDSVTRVTGGVRLTGWARDDDNAGAAIEVQALVDGNAVGGTGAAGHGFDFTVPMDAAAHQVCVRALNIEGGNHVTLPGCVQVEQLWHDPEGHLDSATRIDGGQVRLRGWASDADITGPIQVQALLDGAVAGQTTADVGGQGFDFVVKTDWRTHQACAKALNAGGGGLDTVLPGCVQVPYALCPDTAPTITSTRARDDILPTPGDDVIWATGGGARIAGSAGNDIICGGGATGGPGGNQIIGGPGNNLIFTGPGNNDVVAGPGHTQIVSGGGHNRFAVCPTTVVLNRSATDEIVPSGNCGAPPVTALQTQTPAPATPTTTTTVVPTTTVPAPQPPSTIPSAGGAPQPDPPPTSTEVRPAAATSPPYCAGTSIESAGDFAVAGAGPDGAAVRLGPSPYHPVAYSLGDGDPLSITCYVDSVAVDGNTRWNRLADGRWVADAFTNTPKV